MKFKDLKKLFSCICLPVIILLGVNFSSYASDQIVIKAVSGLPKNFLAAQPLFKVMEKFNQKAKGEAIIKYVGGPEVFPAPNQAMAVRQGVVDLSQNYAGIYSGLVPAGGALQLSRLTPKEERETGVFEYIRELHSKANLTYLGRSQSAPPGKGLFWIWTVKPVKTPEDLVGMRIGGVSPAANDFIKALGAIPKVVGVSEGYTAIERKILDGWWISLEDVVATGMYEVLPYMIDHPWYCDNHTFIMNPNSWKKLPGHLQELLMQSIIEIENTWYLEVENRWAKDKKIMSDAGMKFLYFSPDDAKRFNNIAYEAAWEELLKKHPDFVPKLKKMFSK